VSGYISARSARGLASIAATCTEASISSAISANSAAAASPTVPAIMTWRAARSGTAWRIRLTRVQLRGVQAMVWPRRSASSVVSNRSGRPRRKAATAGWMPAPGA
jgi:hypothetical protein